MATKKATATKTADTAKPEAGEDAAQSTTTATQDGSEGTDESQQGDTSQTGAQSGEPAPDNATEAPAQGTGLASATDGEDQYTQEQLDTLQQQREEAHEVETLNLQIRAEVAGFPFTQEMIPPEIAERGDLSEVEHLRKCLEFLQKFNASPEGIQARAALDSAKAAHASGVDVAAAAQAQLASDLKNQTDHEELMRRHRETQAMHTGNPDHPAQALLDQLDAELAKLGSGSIYDTLAGLVNQVRAELK